MNLGPSVFHESGDMDCGMMSGSFTATVCTVAIRDYLLFVFSFYGCFCSRREPRPLCETVRLWVLPPSPSDVGFIHHSVSHT